MEWTDQHDVLMLREIIVRNVFSFKKGSVSRGNVWDSIAEKLNQIDSPQFRIKDKRGVRERWELLRRKFKSKNREEEAASDIAVEEFTEKEALIEELIAREETAKPDEKSKSSSRMLLNEFIFQAFGFCFQVIKMLPSRKAKGFLFPPQS